jgi:galactose mutarotase-like enzyme
VPVAPGWHPYFRCPAAEKTRVTGDLTGLPPDALRDDREFDFGIEAPPLGRVRFSIPGLGGALALSFAPAMRHLQFWSQPGKDFVCIEPFLGPANTINTEKRVSVPPGTARDFWMRIELVP